MNAVRKPAPLSQQPDLQERATSLKDSLARIAHHDTAAQSAKPRDYADRFDFSCLSVDEIARLSEACRMVADIWMNLGNSPYCYSEKKGSEAERSIWHTYAFESDRVGHLRDRCIAELENRAPADRWERDEILRARIWHELECNNSVAEPGLLVEAMKAWG